MRSPVARFVFNLVPALAIVAAGCSAVGTDQQPTPIPTPVTISKPSYRVQRGDVVLSVSLSGSVVPINPVLLSFKQDGKIKTFDVQKGDAVKKDQVLAQLDISDLTKALNTAQFNLDQDSVKLANSEKITKFALQK